MKKLFFLLFVFCVALPLKADEPMFHLNLPALREKEQNRHREELKKQLPKKNLATDNNRSIKQKPEIANDKDKKGQSK